MNPDLHAIRDPRERADALASAQMNFDEVDRARKTSSTASSGAPRRAPASPTRSGPRPPLRTNATGAAGERDPLHAERTSRARSIEPAAGETLLDALREHVRRHLAEGRLPAAGPVRLLPGARRRRGRNRHLRDSPPSERERHARCSRWRALSSRERDAGGAGLRGRRCHPVRLLHPGMVMRAKHLLDLRPNPTLTRSRAPSRGTSADARATRSARRSRSHGRQAARRPAARAPHRRREVGRPLARYQVGDHGRGRGPLRGGHARDGMLHGALGALRPPAGASAGDRRTASARPGERVVATAVDVPGARADGLRALDWPRLVAEGEVDELHRRRAGRRRGRRARVARAAAALVEITTSRWSR